MKLAAVGSNCIDFYNNIRPHKTNHYKSPTELEAKYFDSKHGTV
jgi:hypothetical protein